MSRVEWVWPRLIARAAILLWLCAVPGLQRTGLAQPPEGTSEYEIKAAFLLNFVKFVEWPAGQTGPLNICLWADDPFGGTMDRLVAQESVNGRRIVVRRIRRWPENCQAVFIHGSFRDAFRLLRRFGPGVLTVGEAPGFLSDGGMIRFVIDDRRIRFDVNQKAAEAAGLRLSSRMLSAARTVLQ